MTDIINKLKDNSLIIDKAISEKYGRFADKDTESVRKAELYSLTAGGKRIRAFLVNEFCRACNGDIAQSLDFAVAVEMMHTFSLIHDDLPCMDNDDLRRGKPTSHKVFGEATALLAGDSLAVRSLFTAASNSSVSPSVALAGARLLADAVGSEGMIGGQIIDMRGESEKLDFETLLKLHKKKTGALIIASAKLGCLAAGINVDDGRYKAAEVYAENIGLAFQIIDDILDVTSESSVLGKNVGVDESRNKTTFLSFMTVDEAREYAKRLTDDAKSALACFADAETLSELADYLLIRKQ
ncbi:MAG: polyprenyl synthetase family protein [Eubacteriales bacterium]